MDAVPIFLTERNKMIFIDPHGLLEVIDAIVKVMITNTCYCYIHLVEYGWHLLACTSKVSMTSERTSAVS